MSKSADKKKAAAQFNKNRVSERKLTIIGLGKRTGKDDENFCGQTMTVNATIQTDELIDAVSKEFVSACYEAGYTGSILSWVFEGEITVPRSTQEETTFSRLLDENAYIGRRLLYVVGPDTSLEDAAAAISQYGVDDPDSITVSDAPGGTYIEVERSKGKRTE